MTLDSELQRKIMGMFATGVTVVSMKTGEGSWGMTANAITSLSLDPPLVLVAVDKDNQTNHHLRQATGGCMGPVISSPAFPSIAS